MTPQSAGMLPRSEEKDPLVTVVIPARNAAATIDRAVRSALAAAVPVEVVVVDDGSTDGTAQAAGEDPRLRVISGSWGGAGAARNQGVAAARGEFVAFLDADDAWRPGRLAREVELFRKDPGLVLVCTDSVTLGGDSPGKRGFHQHAAGLAFAEPLGGDVWVWADPFPALCAALFVNTSSVVVRKAVFRKLGGFETRFPIAEDFDLWLRLALQGTFAGLREPAVCIHDVPDSLCSDEEAMLQATEEMLAGFQARNGRLPRAHRRALQARQGRIAAHRAYRARMAGRRGKALGAYVRSLFLKPSWVAVRGLAATVMAKPPSSRTAPQGG